MSFPIDFENADQTQQISLFPANADQSLKISLLLENAEQSLQISLVPANAEQSLQILLFPANAEQSLLVKSHLLFPQSSQYSYLFFRLSRSESDASPAGSLNAGQVLGSNWGHCP